KPGHHHPAREFPRISGPGVPVDSSRGPRGAVFPLPDLPAARNPAEPMGGGRRVRADLRVAKPRGVPSAFQRANGLPGALRAGFPCAAVGTAGALRRTPVLECGERAGGPLLGVVFRRDGFGANGSGGVRGMGVPYVTGRAEAVEGRLLRLTCAVRNSALLLR